MSLHPHLVRGAKADNGTYFKGMLRVKWHSAHTPLNPMPDSSRKASCVTTTANKITLVAFLCVRILHLFFLTLYSGEKSQETSKETMLLSQA